MTDDQPIHLTRAELKDLIKEAVAEAFDDIGVRTDKAEHVDEAREDFRFIRRLRRAYEGAAAKIGGTILVAIIGGIVYALWIGAQLALTVKTGAPQR